VEYGDIRAAYQDVRGHDSGTMPGRYVQGVVQMAVYSAITCSSSLIQGQCEWLQYVSIISETNFDSDKMYLATRFGI